MTDIPIDVSVMVCLLTLQDCDTILMSHSGCGPVSPIFFLPFSHFEGLNANAGMKQGGVAYLGRLWEANRAL